MKASVPNMFALTFPNSLWIHCVFVLNSLVNIYQEHFYISGHGSQLSCCEEQESHSSTWGGDHRDRAIMVCVAQDWGVLARERWQGHTQAPGLITALSPRSCDILPKPVLGIHWSKKPSWYKGFSCFPTEQNIYQPWREILSVLSRNELCSLAHHTDVRTPSFPRSDSRPMESILQMLWHSVLDTTCRACSSQEALSCLSFVLQHLNVQTGMAVMGLHLTLFRGTHWSNYAH